MDEQGPFDRILQPDPAERNDRAAKIVVGVSIVLGLFLLILVLPPISVFDDEDGGVTGPVTAELRDELPPPPAGFEAVSELLDLSAPGGSGPAQGEERPRLTLDLTTPVADGETLVFFTFIDEEWRRLADATAVAGGGAAQGEVPFIPSNVAVFRPTGQAAQEVPDEPGTAEAVTSRVVLGSLPPGAQPDPRAIETLTTLNPAGLTPLADGQIAGLPLELPEGLNVPVAPTVSAFTPEEIDALNGILASPELRTAHVQALLALVGENDYAGVDLDYRTIDAARSADFVAFVTELSDGLQAVGRTLTITLPAPVRQEDAWDTLGFDWEGLAPLVDAVKLAPEQEQDRYHARMEEALGYLVPRVGNSKLLVTVGPLSRERGVDGVRTLGLTEALALASTPVVQPEGPVPPDATVQALGQNLASETGASVLRWDETASAVVFSYTGPGGERTVWLANVFSEAFKLELASRFQLGGVAVEDVSREREDANIWPAVTQYAETGELELVIPNGDLLQPRWAASGGGLEGDVGPVVTWRAPAEAGTYTLTLIVSDGVMRVGQELRLAVEGPAQGAGPP